MDTKRQLKSEYKKNIGMMYKKYNEKISEDTNFTLPESTINNISQLDKEFNSDFCISISQLDSSRSSSILEALNKSNIELVEFYGRPNSYSKNIKEIMESGFTFENAGRILIKGVPYTFDDCDSKSIMNLILRMLVWNVVQDKTKKQNRYYIMLDLDSIIKEWSVENENDDKAHLAEPFKNDCKIMSDWVIHNQWSIFEAARLMISVEYSDDEILKCYFDMFLVCMGGKITKA